MAALGGPLWSEALTSLGRLADELDHARRVPALPATDRTRRQRLRRTRPPGGPASAWAVAKAWAGLLTAPVGVPALAVAARATQRETLERIHRFPDHLLALAGGRSSPLPATRTRRLDAGRRYVITSDLHRCVPGRLDWPDRQGTKVLYRRVLERYAEDGWDLVENGDVEDFWMVGGSTWGAVYDVARLAAGAAGSLADEPRRGLLREHLDRIVDNNAALYALLREGFCRDGRYHRTMGNHDDVFDDPALCSHLATHLPGTEVVDTLLLTDGLLTDGLLTDGLPTEGPATGGIEGVRAVVAHGHLTDAWNGPGFALLGRAITWWATGLDDLPRLTARDALPDEQAVGRLLDGTARNRLVTLDPRFGGNRRFDSLDEQRLFARLAEVAPSSTWPWLLFGHTHYPMLRPLDAAGTPVRYANSGTGVLDGAVTLLEWEPDAEEPVRLVLYLADDDGAPHRVDLEPDGATLRAVPARVR
jgi:hypothetical protein